MVNVSVSPLELNKGVSGRCAVEDCDRPAHCRGWCKKHYERWRLRGTTDANPDNGRFQKGQVAHNKAQWLDKVCPKCGATFSVKPSLDRVTYCSRSCAQKGKSSPLRGRSLSPETRQKIRQAHLGRHGPEHWNWKDGGVKRRERHTLMNRDEYKQWRWGVFSRDDFACRRCGYKGSLLRAHHHLEWSLYPSLRYEVANGFTLCEPCHLAVHRERRAS